MIKTWSSELFGISLTEIIIILFFVLLLLSFYKIANLTLERGELADQNQELKIKIGQLQEQLQYEIEVNEILAEDMELDFGQIPASKIIVRIDLSAPAVDLSPAEEIRHALNLLDGLIEDQQVEDSATAQNLPIDLPEGTGQYGECLGNFIDCAKHCWPLKSPVLGTSREYEYLLDIGFCEDSYLVQPSVFEIAGVYTEKDFDNVPAAKEVADRGFVSELDLFSYLVRIRALGENQSPADQCKFATNLVDLSSTKSQWTIASDKGPAPLNLFTHVVNQNDEDYEIYRNRFDLTKCEITTALPLDRPIPVDNENSIEDEQNSVAKDRPDYELVSESNDKELPQVAATQDESRPNQNLPIQAQLNWNGRPPLKCPSRRFRNPEMTIRLTVIVSPTEEISFSYPETLNATERRIARLIEEAIREAGATIPKINGRRVASSITKTYRIRKNLCI